METLKRLLYTFVLVLAGITISATIFITLFYPELYDIIVLLWQIIILAVVCTLGNLIYYSRKEIGKKQMKVRMILHYLYINVVNICGALLFQWISPGFLLEFIVLLLLVAISYICIMMTNFHKEEKTAENMNKLLRKLHTDENEVE